MKVDLYINGDLLDPSDKKLVMQLPLKDKMVQFCLQALNQLYCINV